MKNYKDMYYKLFNGITDIITLLEKLQQETEEIYISQPQDDTSVNKNYLKH